MAASVIRRVTRPTQLIALTYFTTGEGSSVSFSKKYYNQSLNDDIKEQLEKMTKLEMLDKRVSYLGVEFVATKKMGVPIAELEPVTREEMEQFYKTQD